MIRPLLLVALFAAAAHAERPADYAFGLPLTPGGPDAFQRVAVPASVYEGAVARDLADVRLFNADGELVPFAWVPRRPVPRERAPAIALPMFPLYVDRDKRDVSGLALTVVKTRRERPSVSTAPITNLRLERFWVAMCSMRPRSRNLWWR